MLSKFENLPRELQQKVIENLNDNISDIYECTIVSNDWKNLFQKELYFRVELNSFSESVKFLNTIKGSQYLNGYVKELLLYFEIDHRNLHENATISTLLSRLPELEDIFCPHGVYYRIVSDLLIMNQLPRLCLLETPETDEGENDYITCALLLKDRLKNLKITESFYEDVDDDESFHTGEDPVKFNRLFNPLHTFVNLQDLHIENKADDKIDLIEKVTQICPLLKRLNVEFIPSESNMDVTSTITENSVHACNVIHLELCIDISKDPKFVNYIILKFPKLKSLQIIGKQTRLSNLDTFTHKKFLKYLSKINSVDISNIV